MTIQNWEILIMKFQKIMIKIRIILINLVKLKGGKTIYIPTQMVLVINSALNSSISKKINRDILWLI